jgi:hypothetical protein
VSVTRAYSRAMRWPIRSVFAGAAGTAAMTHAYAAERRLRPGVTGPLDYDDSLVPVWEVRGHMPFDVGREKLGGRIDIALVPRLVRPTNHLDVLLRHRPPSTPRGVVAPSG